MGSGCHSEVIITQKANLCLAPWMALPAASSLCSALHRHRGGGTKDHESFNSDAWYDKSGNFQSCANRMVKLPYSTQTETTSSQDVVTLEANVTHATAVHLGSCNWPRWALRCFAKAPNEPTGLRYQEVMRRSGALPARRWLEGSL